MTYKPTDAELVARLHEAAKALRLEANAMIGMDGDLASTLADVAVGCNYAADRIEQLSAQVAALQAKEGVEDTIGAAGPGGGNGVVLSVTRPDAGPGGVHVLSPRIRDYAGMFETSGHTDAARLMRLAASELDRLMAGPGGDLGTRWRHKKRGTTYRITGWSLFQSDDGHDGDEAIVHYQAEDGGACYSQPLMRFLDGRFERLAAAPSPPAPETK